MQSIIVFIIISFIVSLLLTNFIKLAVVKNGEDFNINEYIQNFKFSNIDIKYWIIVFIIFETIMPKFSLVELITIAPLCFALLIAFIMDFKFMIIPDTSSVIITLAGIVNLITKFSKENLLSSILGATIGGGIILLIDCIFKKITKKDGFGLGDVKLLASLGLFFGLKSIAVIMVLSVIISAIFGIGYLIKNKVKKLSEAYLPFGPFIVISTFIVLVVPAQVIINSYLYILDSIVNKMI